MALPKPLFKEGDRVRVLKTMAIKTVVGPTLRHDAYYYVLVNSKGVFDTGWRESQLVHYFGEPHDRAQQSRG